MITIIFGDDTKMSREKLNVVTKEAKNITKLYGKSFNIGDLESALISNDLFVDEKTVLLDSFKIGQINKEIISLLQQAKGQKLTHIVVWIDGDLTPKALDKIPNDFSYNYKLPKLYFLFLDSLQPKNGIKLTEILEKLKAQYTPEQIFYSAVKRVRELVLIRTQEYSSLEGFKRMQPWQISKLKQQSFAWDTEQLNKFYIKLSEIEVDMKSSGLTLPLSKHLDILLLSDLN